MLILYAEMEIQQNPGNLWKSWSSAQGSTEETHGSRTRIRDRDSTRFPKGISLITFSGDQETNKLSTGQIPEIL